MSSVWTNEIDKILGVGISLEQYGVRNWGLVREDALVAIAQLQKAEIPILGGDVYFLDDQSVELSFDNWSCDQGASESQKLFLARSAEMSRGYVTNYHANGRHVLFAIVPQVEGQARITVPGSLPDDP